MTVKKLRYGRVVSWPWRCRVPAFWLDEKCSRAIWLVEKISSMPCRDRAVCSDFSHSYEICSHVSHLEEICTAYTPISNNFVRAIGHDKINMYYGPQSLLPKYTFFDIVRVCFYLIVSKLDFNVIPTMHFGLGLTYVPCRIALTTFFEIGVCTERDGTVLLLTDTTWSSTRQ
jgi:hypothetical protein